MPFSNIDKPASYFNTVLYTGTGSSNARTGVGFQPDWVWIKARSSAQSHWVVDVIRGADKRLQTNTTSADSTQVTGVTSFDTDGFTVGTDNSTNGSGTTFVSWCWDANGAGVSNTSGTISSTVSANTTSGFSIVSYTGTGANATVGHGLGVAPRMIIFKSRNSATSWPVYHASIGATQFGALNASDAFSASSLPFNNTAPTSSVFSLGSSGGTNSTSMIAYCFSEIKGYSKFGSYTGNGSTDGTFIYTGFKPSWIMFKRSDGVQDWYIYDNKRNTFNPENLQIDAMDSGAESTLLSGDFVSNGFKFRSLSSAFNTSGGTYIYMAFAENPFVSSKGIPTTAR
jgi:hypothetical protein